MLTVEVDEYGIKFSDDRYEAESALRLYPVSGICPLGWDTEGISWKVENTTVRSVHRTQIVRNADLASRSHQSCKINIYKVFSPV